MTAIQSNKINLINTLFFIPLKYVMKWFLKIQKTHFCSRIVGTHKEFYELTQIMLTLASNRADFISSGGH